MSTVTDNSTLSLDDIRDNVRRQTLMALIGAEATAIEPGRVVIELPYRADLCQQNGFLHAAVIASIAESPMPSWPSCRRR
jgi:acyl-coenzyme A thioesterase PaaI-like protein